MSGKVVTLALSEAQIASVMGQVSGDAGLAGPLASLGEVEPATALIRPLLEDPRYSRSVLRALLLLAACPPDRSGHEVTSVAKRLAMSASTAHRYLSTWVAVGLLERDPQSRQYRRAPIASAVGVGVPLGHDAGA